MTHPHNQTTHSAHGRTSCLFSVKLEDVGFEMLLYTHSNAVLPYCMFTNEKECSKGWEKRNVYQFQPLLNSGKVVQLVSPAVGVTLCTISVSAPEPSLQHHEREEPRHGSRREEEVCDEASSGGPSGNKENLLCQLHRHLQTVSLEPVHFDAHLFKVLSPN